MGSPEGKPSLDIYIRFLRRLDNIGLIKIKARAREEKTATEKQISVRAEELGKMQGQNAATVAGITRSTKPS